MKQVVGNHCVESYASKLYAISRQYVHKPLSVKGELFDGGGLKRRLERSENLVLTKPLLQQCCGEGYGVDMAVIARNRKLFTYMNGKRFGF